MHRDFTLWRFHWCGKSTHVYYRLWGWLPIKIVSNVSAANAVEVVSALFAINRKKRVPKSIKCIWFSYELEECE